MFSYQLHNGTVKCILLYYIIIHSFKNWLSKTFIGCQNIRVHICLFHFFVQLFIETSKLLFSLKGFALLVLFYIHKYYKFEVQQDIS